MLKAYKYRLYPNLEQREYLVKTFGVLDLYIKKCYLIKLSIIKKLAKC